MKVEKLVPEVYYKDSRDFAYIGRLFELIFNYMKTGADCVKVNYVSNKDVADSGLVELLADTLGFTVRRNYDNQTLAAIASSFQKLLRNKGSIYAVELALNLLINAQTLKSSHTYEYSASLDHIIQGYNGESEKIDLLIQLPSGLEDTILLEDLFNYILPAGMLYKIIYTEAAEGLDNSNNIFTINTNQCKIINLGNTSRPLSTIQISSDEAEYNLEGTDPYMLFREVPKDLDCAEIYPKINPEFTIASFNCDYSDRPSSIYLSGSSIADCLIDASKRLYGHANGFDVIALQNVSSATRLNVILEALNNHQDINDSYICSYYFSNKCAIISKLAIRYSTQDELSIRDLGAGDGNYGYLQLKYPNNLNNSYKDSKIHKWLNDDFLDVAFSSEELSNICDTLIDNTSKDSTGYDEPLNPTDSGYQAKAFLLSRQDVKNAEYGFSSDGSAEDSARMCSPTDYTKYLIANSNTPYSVDTNAWWWLRTASSAGATSVHRIKTSGDVHSANSLIDVGGVLPAIRTTEELENQICGMYPQSKLDAVDDADLIATLCASLSKDDFQILSDKLCFVDVENVVEGITFKYRGVQDIQKILLADSIEFKTGINWFKFEPINWKLLSNNTADNTYLYLADKVLDISSFSDSQGNVGDLKEAALNIYIANTNTDVEILGKDIKEGKVVSSDTYLSQRTNYIVCGPIGADSSLDFSSTFNRNVDSSLNVNHPAGGPFETFNEAYIDDIYYHNNAWSMKQLSVVMPIDAESLSGDETQTITADRMHKIIVANGVFRGPYRQITDK